jgi:hypothetical protein
VPVVFHRASRFDHRFTSAVGLEGDRVWRHPIYGEKGVALLEDLPEPRRLAAVRVGGIDMNRPRIRAVMHALLALSPSPIGFTSSELAAKAREALGDPHHSPSRAGYDLRKFRCDDLVCRIPRSRRYALNSRSVAAIAALLLLREKVIRPLLAAAFKTPTTPAPHVTSLLDTRYRAVEKEMPRTLHYAWIGSARVSRTLHDVMAASGPRARGRRTHGFGP